MTGAAAIEAARLRQPDRLTEEERAAIEAFDKRKIKKLPACTFSDGFVAGVSWRDPAHKRKAARDQKFRKLNERRERQVAPEKGPKRMFPRQAEAVRLAEQGLTAAEAAAKMGVGAKAVYSYLTGTGVKFRRVEVETLAAKIRRLAPDYTARDLAEKLGTTPSHIYTSLKRTGIKCKRAETKGARSSPMAETVVSLARAGTLTQAEIAAEAGCSGAYVSVLLRKAGIAAKPARRKGRSRSGDKARETKERRAVEGAARMRDRRRFKTVPVPFGDPAVKAPADARGSIFPTRVFDPSPAEGVLKDGSSNSKVGGDVLVGWLEGARIVTLTLEERATCPRSCPIWEGCYGNAMQHSRRWRHGPELEARIREEVAGLCAVHAKVLVRLHVLGDFYSLDYVAMWGELMVEHDGLAAFGFTAHPESSEIGAEIARLRGDFGRRWSIRHSGRTGAWGSFTLDFPTAKKRIGDALVCPEQRDAMEGGGRGVHCGSCAACWSCDAPIAFVEH